MPALSFCTKDVGQIGMEKSWNFECSDERIDLKLY